MGTSEWLGIDISTPAFEINGTPTAVPEPATLLLGTGVGVAAARRRVKRRE